MNFKSLNEFVNENVKPTKLRKILSYIKDKMIDDEDTSKLTRIEQNSIVIPVYFFYDEERYKKDIYSMWGKHGQNALEIENKFDVKVHLSYRTETIISSPRYKKVFGNDGGIIEAILTFTDMG